jgi:PST family polysaccharide transporter
MRLLPSNNDVFTVKRPSVTNPASNLAASALRGVRWNYLGGISASLCSLAIGIVLARILGPRPFGQVIIASMIYGFLNLFVDGGFSQALIQRPSLTEEDIRKTFTCQVAIGLCTTALVYLSAPWIARRFHDPSAVYVVQAMALIITIQSTGLVSAALLRRSMRFKAVQYAALTSYLLGFLVVGIPLALRGAGVWSLVIAYLTQSAVNSILLHAAARHSIKPMFAWPDRSIVSFGATIVGNNLVNWGHSNLDNVAASGLGPVALGLYGRGCNFAYQPVTTVVNGLQSVLLSSAARAQDRQHRMRELTLAVMAIVFGILGAAYVTFALIPATTIVGLYGDKWVGVIPLMIPFALAMPFYGVHTLMGPILCGLGRPELEFWPQLLSCGFAAILYFSAARASLACIAWALLVVMLVRFGAIAVFTFRLLRISWAEAARVMLQRATFSAAFAGIVWVADYALRAAQVSATPRLVLLGALCAALLGWCMVQRADFVFGRQAVEFLLSYGAHLPPWYVKRLRLRADWHDTEDAAVAQS